mmetsp:Transcript_48454/g.95998  ORF Transcript_48454/g.95998 Transcript_48454/m.95998 type:complete len:87 (-) Transcript_48454:878-1138(-)
MQLLCDNHSLSKHDPYLKPTRIFISYHLSFIFFFLNIYIFLSSLPSLPTPTALYLNSSFHTITQISPFFLHSCTVVHVIEIDLRML